MLSDILIQNFDYLSLQEKMRSDMFTTADIVL